PEGIALFDAFAEPGEAPATSATIAGEPQQAAAIQDAVEETVREPAHDQTGEAAAKTPVENPPAAIVSPQAAPITPGMVEPPSGQASLSQEPPAPRQHPLRFLWQMDAEGRFVLLSDEFIRLIGAHTAAGFGRPWREIAETFSLDPDGRVAQALASHDTWAGITVNWPTDGGAPLPVELAGLPTYDQSRNFAGFKGFGVCRDLDALNRLDSLRRFELLAEPPPPPIEPPAPEPEPTPEPELHEPTSDANSHPTEPDTPVETPVEPPLETPPNVVPFRPHGDVRSQGDQRSPTLTPIENSAFNELARQLSERLERERETIAADSPEPVAEIIAEPPAPEPLRTGQ
ncbi:PAS domain-containing sensor histidine kinase, partial [Bradyrhizobium sp. PRIMUS42]|nr:PAS domain-containing sensor histidine kinase [Bradyrhizobium sp. PRIMUS42]